MFLPMLEAYRRHQVLLSISERVKATGIENRGHIWDLFTPVKISRGVSEM